MTFRRYKTIFNVANYEYDRFDQTINSGNLQKVTISSSNHYTSGGYDMIDNINQRIIHGTSYPIDRVNGYSATQLQNALVGAKKWNDWRDNIKNGNFNATEVYLDELFNNWQD